ncbi:hypothetical protein ColTof4_12958 [Colletotrichum tofieldiae]|nr:hypothetical protein ColTof3_14190 [Colletotrichum tofieldiae]GKT80535.1 hypothetical protein ColTof4_12958 [Colletotrichum tofieldiae]GKT94893.1 hypothetical protein Ct61P_12743 [Colletotrichum tofieldiae]
MRLPLSIHFGELPLDPEDQVILQSGILPRELRKMDKLIYKFRELDMCWATENMQSGGDASESQWCRLVVPKIFQELEELEELYQMATENRLTRSRRR